MYRHHVPLLLSSLFTQYCPLFLIVQGDNVKIANLNHLNLLQDMYVLRHFKKSDFSFTINYWFRLIFLLKMFSTPCWHSFPFDFRPKCVQVLKGYIKTFPILVVILFLTISPFFPKANIEDVSSTYWQTLVYL